MGSLERLEPWQQPLAGERGRDAHCQDTAATGNADRIDGRGKAFERRANARETSLACLGEHELPVDALKEGDADMAFQHLHLMADGRRRDAELASGLRKAEMPSRGFVAAERVERGKAAKGLHVTPLGEGCR